MRPNSILVVLPTYNERENVKKIIDELLGLVHNLDVLIIDDNSPDKTAVLVKELRQENNRIHLIERPKKMGLGTAYGHGFQWALEHGYSTVIQMDADFSHQPSYIPAMLEALENCDVVVGSRYVPGGGVDKSWGIGRRF